MTIPTETITATHRLLSITGYASLAWDADPDTDGGMVARAPGDATATSIMVAALRTAGLQVSESDDNGRWVWIVAPASDVAERRREADDQCANVAAGEARADLELDA